MVSLQYVVARGRTLALLTFADALHGFSAVSVTHDHVPLRQERLGRDGSFATRADGSVQ